jgi:hypothetical protein
VSPASKTRTRRRRFSADAPTMLSAQFSICFDSQSSPPSPSPVSASHAVRKQQILRTIQKKDTAPAEGADNERNCGWERIQARLRIRIISPNTNPCHLHASFSPWLPRLWQNAPRAEKKNRTRKTKGMRTCFDYFTPSTKTSLLASAALKRHEGHTGSRCRRAIAFFWHQRLVSESSR